MLMQEPPWGGVFVPLRLAETEDRVQAGDGEQPPDYRLGIHHDELMALCRQARVASQQD